MAAAGGAARVVVGPAVAAPRGRVVERVSPLRLLAGPDWGLPLSLRGHRGGREGGQTHWRQAGAGASVVAGPGGEPQPVTNGSPTASSSSSALQQPAAAPLSQSPSVQGAELAGDWRRELAPVEFLRTYQVLPVNIPLIKLIER